MIKENLNRLCKCNKLSPIVSLKIENFFSLHPSTPYFIFPLVNTKLPVYRKREMKKHGKKSGVVGGWKKICCEMKMLMKKFGMRDVFM